MTREPGIRSTLGRLAETANDSGDSALLTALANRYGVTLEQLLDALSDDSVTAKICRDILWLLIRDPKRDQNDELFDSILMKLRSGMTLDAAVKDFVNRPGSSKRWRDHDAVEKQFTRLKKTEVKRMGDLVALFVFPPTKKGRPPRKSRK